MRIDGNDVAYVDLDAHIHERDRVARRRRRRLEPAEPGFRCLRIRIVGKTATAPQGLCPSALATRSIHASCSSRVDSPHGQSTVFSSLTSAPTSRSACVRSGYVAAKSIDIGPPSETPIRTASLGSDGVEHGAYVVHPFLERPDRESLREAHAALVEQDQARKGRELLTEAPVAGVLPLQLLAEAPVGRVLPRTSRCVIAPATQIRSGGPSPRTWYAISTSPLIAYRTGGALMRAAPAGGSARSGPVAELLVQRRIGALRSSLRVRSSLVAVGLRPADLRRLQRPGDPTTTPGSLDSGQVVVAALVARRGEREVRVADHFVAADRDERRLGPVTEAALHLVGEPVLEWLDAGSSSKPGTSGNASSATSYRPRSSSGRSAQVTISTPVGGSTGGGSIA